MKKILLISVLKPVDDTRSYWKFGKSLSKKFDVYVAGFQGKTYKSSSVTQVPLFSFKRASFLRFFTFIKVFKVIKKIKPDLVIIHAIELLPVFVFLKIFFRYKLIYDIQENYSQNIKSQSVYPNWIKAILSFLARSIEVTTRKWINAYILAEKCYTQELNFIKHKSIVIENKAIISEKFSTNSYKKKEKVKLLFSGSISKHYGIERAIKLTVDLNKAGEKVELKIIGKASDNQIDHLIKSYTNQYPFIKAKISSNPIPYQTILEELANSDFSILSYHINPSNKDRTPTKMYECLAMGIPMIIQKNSTWEKICKPHQAAIFIDFDDYNVESLINEVKNKDFYPEGIVESAEWSDEENKLIRLINKFMLK